MGNLNNFNYQATFLTLSNFHSRNYLQVFLSSGWLADFELEHLYLIEANLLNENLMTDDCE